MTLYDFLESLFWIYIAYLIMIFYYLVVNFLSILIERLINEKTNKYKKSKLSIEPTVLLLSVK